MKALSFFRFLTIWILKILSILITIIGLVSVVFSVIFSCYYMVKNTNNGFTIMEKEDWLLLLGLVAVSGITLLIGVIGMVKTKLIP